MDVAHDVEVEVELLPTDRGGRTQPMPSGLRPVFYYQGRDWVCQVTLPDGRPVPPGAIVRAYLAFLSPRDHIGRLCVGSPFLLREDKVIAFGSVTAILELEGSARRSLAAQEDEPAA